MLVWRVYVHAKLILDLASSLSLLLRLLLLLTLYLNMCCMERKKARWNGLRPLHTVHTTPANKIWHAIFSRLSVFIYARTLFSWTGCSPPRWCNARWTTGQTKRIRPSVFGRTRLILRLYNMETGDGGIYLLLAGLLKLEFHSSCYEIHRTPLRNTPNPKFYRVISLERCAMYSISICVIWLA